MDYDVSIDHMQQREDESEPWTRIEASKIDITQDLGIFVLASLPSGSTPRGEYVLEPGIQPTPGSGIAIDPPQLLDGGYLFTILHYYLRPNSNYWFHFADDLKAPTYESQLRLTTLPE